MDSAEGVKDAPEARSESVRVVGGLLSLIKKLLPNRAVHSALYILPVWMRFADLVTAVLTIAVGMIWIGLEWRWLS